MPPVKFFHSTLRQPQSAIRSEVRHTHAVDDNLDAVHLTATGREGADRIAIEQPLIEVELIDQSGAATALRACQNQRMPER